MAKKKQRRTSVKACPKCKGKKFVTGVVMFGEKQSIKCSRCYGTGKVPA